MHDLRITFEAILDDPGHPSERHIVIDNSLPVCDTTYEGVVLSVKQLSDGTTFIEALRADPSFIFKLPLQSLAPEVTAQMRRGFGDRGGIRIGLYSLGCLIKGWTKPFLRSFVTGVARFIGGTLTWEDDTLETSKSSPHAGKLSSRKNARR